MNHPLFQENWHGRRVLLLQGPVGPFFWRAAKWLRARGATTHKINFNGGDTVFFPAGRLYTRSASKLEATLRALVEATGITDMWLFGDCRPVHRIAITVANTLGVQVWVFEEGYFRPAFITCERGGVNGNSALPTSSQAYDNWPLWEGEQTILPTRPGTFQTMAVQACIYWLMAALLWPLTPFYRHHRSLNVLAEGVRWGRGYARKLYYTSRERGLQDLLVDEFSGKFVLVPLQVHNDAQVIVHSGFADVRNFIAQMLRAFARHACKEHVLAFKHHPLDRAYREYTDWIHKQAALLGIADRVYVLHDQHLPTLLDHAAGAVVINSTVGLAAVHQGVATHVMGKSFYGFEGLTHQGPLAEFLANPAAFKPDANLYLRFRNAVISTTQINESFYKSIRGLSAPHAARSNTHPKPLSVWR